jgi:hypothetical protein
VDLAFDPQHPDQRGNGWFFDDQRPTLTLTYPQPGHNDRLDRILIGMDDYYSGLDMDSFTVTADFAVNGSKPGANLAARFRPVSQGVWELKLAQPLHSLPRSQLIVSIRDQQGNVSRIERTFQVEKERATP